jgi:hypothetical protein
MGLSTVVKRLGPEADHSPPSSAEVKNAYSYTFVPLYVFMAWCLVTHRDNFNFTYIISIVFIFPFYYPCVYPLSMGFLRRFIDGTALYTVLSIS